MKDDTSTPITDGSPNEFERDKPGTSRRHAAEAAIEELRERGGVFVNAVRATRMPMVLTDPNLAGNPIVSPNRAFLKLSGYRMEEVLGQHPHFMDGPGTDPKDAARFEEAIRSDQDDIIEVVQYRKNGSRFVATVLISAFKDEQGHTLNHVMSWLDVTRRVDAEGEVAHLRVAQARLRDSEDRQAFLLKLSDAVRPLADAAEIQATTTRLVGEHLGVDRAMYAEVDGEQGAEIGTIRGQYVRPDPERGRAVPFPDRFSFGEFGESTMAARSRGETLIVRDVETDPAYSREERAAWKAVGVRAVIVAELAKGGRLLAEFAVQSAEPRDWTRAEIELVQDVAERTWAAAERARAETTLRESEEKYRNLFESMDEAYAVVDVLKNEDGKWVDFRFVEVNPAFLKHTKMPPPVGKTATELLGTSNPRWTELYGQALDTGQALRVEESEPTLGLTFDLNIFTLDRAANRVAVLFTNITDRKQAEQALRGSERRANTLLAELQHRVRNTLAVVRSIARRTAQNSSTTEEMLAHFHGRLDAFSRVQAVLTRSGDAKVDLTSLIEDELMAHAARDGEQISIEGPPIALEPRAAERMSLAIHELTTNAVKHGALFGEHGRISISWEKQPSNGGSKLLLNWKETGVTIAPDDIRRGGFGMELLRESLPYDLDAETTVAFEPTGLHFELRMQLPADGA